MDPLLGSLRALAYLCVLATDKPLWAAAAEVQAMGGPASFRDSSLKSDPAGLIELLYRTVADWNWSPDAAEHANLLPPLRSRLAPVARELRSAAATVTWWQAMDRENQVWSHGPASVPRRESLRLDGAVHPWASKPQGGLWTSTALPHVPATWRLAESGEDTGSSLWRLPVLAAARVWELNGPQAWVELCRRYPQDTTAIYGRQWGAWGLATPRVVTPNWREVARDWNGVHLSMEGLLTTEGVHQVVADAGTMLEGWSVESTLWLQWSFETPHRRDEAV